MRNIIVIMKCSIKLDTNYSSIYTMLSSVELTSKERRNHLIKSVAGIGLKAASHFLRNLGYTEMC